MSAPDSNSPFNDPSYTRERLELETRVLAAALRQSLEIGDTEGSSLAHEQIFLLLKASQEMVIDEPLNLPSEVFIDRGRQLPDIDWGSAPEPTAESGPAVNFAPPDQIEEHSVPAPAVETEADADAAFDQAASSEVVQIVEAVVQEVVHELRVGDSADAGGEGSVEIATDASGEAPVEATSAAAEPAAAGAAVAAAVEAARAAVGHIDPTVADQSPLQSADHEPSAAAEPSAVSEPSAAAEPSALPEPVSAIVGETETARSEAAAEQEPAASSILESHESPESRESGESGESGELAVSGAPALVNDYYSQLKVTDLADFPSIHQSFWRMLRPLLMKEIGLVGTDRLPHLRSIQRLWIAHDILCDPVTRADYDFRRMGLRGGEEDEAGRHARKTSGQRTQLRIGELLQCAGLLEQTELDIAADMHKAMPEMMFGTFLVKQGFIEEADLDCVLIGQQLLKSGDITVVQFQTVMVERSATGLDIGEMLLAKGYVNQTMLERAYRNQSEDTLVKVPIVVASGQKTTIEGKPAGHHEATEEAAEAAAKAAPEAPSGASSGAAAMAAAEAASSAASIAAAAAASNAAATASAEASEASAIAAAQVAPKNPNLVTERSLNLRQAAPAWKDQLDWSSPEPEPSAEHVAATAAPGQTPDELDAVSAPEQVQGTEGRSKWSAPDAVSSDQVDASSEKAPDLVASEMNDALAESVRAIAQIWAEEPNPVSIWARQPEAGEATPPEEKTTGPLHIVPEDVSAPSMAEPDPTGDSNAFPAEAGQDMSDNPFVGGSDPDFSPASAPEPTPVSALNYPAAAGNGSGEDSPSITDPSLAPVDSDDTVSEIETSSQLPSLGQLEMQAKEKLNEQEAMKRGTGEWQIMSVPGSALTSLFLDDEPEATHKEPPSTKEVTGNMSAFTDDIEQQYQTGARKAQAAPPSLPPTPSQDEKPGGDQPPDNESRKARRRRTRH